MSNDQDERLNKLEVEMQSLKKSVATSVTPVLGIAAIVALIAFLWIMSEVPSELSEDSGPRFWVGAGSLVGGMFLLGLAINFTRFAMRALVEIAVVLLAFVDIIIGAILWYGADVFADTLGAMESATEGEARFLILAAGAIAVFLINVAILFVLYPVARASGSSALDLD